MGYSPSYNLWLKTTITNDTKEDKEMIIEYNNPLTTNIQFFNPDNEYILEAEGLFFTKDSRKTVNPIFLIKLKSKETKTYYFNISTYITTLIVNIKLWDIHQFYKKELLHQSILALFFGAMLVLLLYNLFVFFFTKDKSYLYYVMYIIGIVFHQIVFVGISNIYFFNEETITFIIDNSTFFVVFPVFALALFTKSFLKLEQYPIHNKILNILLILVPFNIILLLNVSVFEKYRNIISLLLLSYLMYVTIYTLYKKNKQAKFIFVGWIIFFISGVLMILSSTGVFNIYEFIPYFLEVSLLTEAIVFSVALSNRIKILQEENIAINKKMIIQKENEKRRLKKQVDEKTKDLNNALDERELLLKELNHRVKNNMQTIVSLIRLQNDEIENEVLNNILVTIQNRINAMSYLHELLYSQDNMTYVNANHYFKLLCEEIKASYCKDINIELNIEVHLEVEQAMYCGLVLNELITNSFKYAFPNTNNGMIFIDLTKENNIYNLVIQDSGIGYDNAISSLGLTIVDNLVRRQLKGKIETISSQGVKNIINWKKNEKN